jgi:hypothetical protein
MPVDWVLPGPPSVEEQLQDLVDQINAAADGYYAQLIDLETIPDSWYILLKENVPRVRKGFLRLLIVKFT